MNNTNNIEEQIQDIYSDFVFKSSLYSQYQQEYKVLEKEAEILEKTREIISTSAKATQDQFKKDLSDIVTMALHIVFGDEYSFKIRFVQRRNTTEADLLLIENEQELNPLDASGFGVVDVISVALRMAYWKLQGSRNCIIWDEPIRFLSPDLHKLMANMIQEISKEFGLQLIIITQIPSLINIADEVFKVKKIGKISQLSQVS